ncbi:hypothetical protein EIKCOROL_02446 [Eikenella corrodens ATCC 23834]|uniref:Uncharacterized protein n=1 Tax=Eikenella corrodens ATCC 23834 TaxID=546274 RepID=C0DYI2_EIKCO|nr:hypothetical protein EIKCOROL_02446 [Eikenella corrodens ATCC 23834]
MPLGGSFITRRRYCNGNGKWPLYRVWPIQRIPTLAFSCCKANVSVL